MKFTPKTEKELAAEGLMAEGTYPLEVVKAAPKQSAAGNDMIVVTLRVFETADSGCLLDDYLMEAVAYKLFHFCAYSGLTKQYEAGTLTADDCVGKSGYVKVGIQKGKKKDDGSGEVWPDRNSVKDYVRQDTLKKAGVIPAKAPAKDDGEDVPF